MSILLDKQETNILRNGDNPQLERRVQPRKILSLPYILSCLPTRRCGSFVAYTGVFIVDAHLLSVSN